MGNLMHVTGELFAFLRELAKNNEKEWFDRNRDRYENVIKEPMKRFIAEAQERFVKFAPQFQGSLMRIHRDIRFSKDKSPYKTNVGLHFRHRAGKDVHAPGFYLHLAPGEVFIGTGLWHPDPPTLARLRDAIVKRPADWKKARGKHTLAGDSYARPPRGVDPEHPFVEDLKRKDFITSFELDEKQACSGTFLKLFVEECRKAAPFNQFLTRAVGLPW